MTASLSANDTPDWISDSWTLQSGGATFIIWLVSYDSNLRRNTIVDGVTPEITISVSYQIGSAGIEYTANVENLNVGTFTYPENGQGQRQAQAPVTVTKPSDPRFGYWTLYVNGPDFTHKQFSGPEYSTTINLDFNGYPWTPENWTFYAVSHDTGGRANTNPVGVTFVSGTFETVSVGPPPPGSSGVEYTSLVGNPASGVQFEYQTRVTLEGVEEFRVYCRWSNPADVTFAGVKIVPKRTFPALEYMTGEYTGPNETEGSTKWHTIVDGEKVIIYLVSVDVNGKENGINETLTPKSSEYTTTQNATGQLKGNRLSAATVGLGLQVSGVLRVAPQGITEALVLDFAISKQKLANLPIIDSFRVETAAIQNAHFDRASASKVAIVDADVVSLSCAKLLAGTITATISMTSAALNVTNGSQTLRFNFGGDSMAVYDSSTFSVARLNGTQLSVQATAGSNAASAVVSTSTGVTITGLPGAGCSAALNANASTAALSLMRTFGTGRQYSNFYQRSGWRRRHVAWGNNGVHHDAD